MDGKAFWACYGKSSFLVRNEYNEQFEDLSLYCSNFKLLSAGKAHPFLKVYNLEMKWDVYILGPLPPISSFQRPLTNTML